MIHSEKLYQHMVLESMVQLRDRVLVSKIFLTMWFPCDVFCYSARNRGTSACGWKSFHLRGSIMDSHLRESVENVSSVSNMDNNSTLVLNMETWTFISEETHSPITSRFWVNIWCVSHKGVSLKKKSHNVQCSVVKISPNTYNMGLKKLFQIHFSIFKYWRYIQTPSF